jgi:hypothetical protein
MQLTRAQLSRYVRARLPAQLYDETCAERAGTAIYGLSDPRDIRALRYVGQSAAPRRRLLQHIATARLWLPAQTPWWVPKAKLRPLYQWIRALFAEEGRLPVMVVMAWVPPEQGRGAERAQIQAAIERQEALLNYEAELGKIQLSLPLSAPTDA